MRKRNLKIQLAILVVLEIAYIVLNAASPKFWHQVEYQHDLSSLVFIFPVIMLFLVVRYWVCNKSQHPASCSNEEAPLSEIIPTDKQSLNI